MPITTGLAAGLPLGIVAAVLGACRPKPSSADHPDAGVVHAATSVVASTPSAPLGGVPRGKLFYERYCALCHGANGHGYAADNAPALANEEFLAIASDAFLRHAIANGRPRTTMSGWSVARGGPLLDEDITALVAYIREWQKRPHVSVDQRQVSGQAARGRRVYAKECASCHGERGEGGKFLAIANPQFLASVADGFLATAIERGRPNTPMPAFSGRLSEGTIDDVTVLIRSWQRPSNEKLELPPAPGMLKTVVIHPRGHEPALDDKADFVSVDAVKRELDRGASLVIADARAPSDYAEMHIGGAISVPFYRVGDYAPEIPKNRYIVTYCACPHAESSMARDEFRRLGYSRVAVLDEGMSYWRDRGFPVRGGSAP